MGDASVPHGARTVEHQPSSYYDGSQHGDKPFASHYTGPGTTDGTAFHSQYSGVPQQPRVDTSRSHAFVSPSPYGASHGQSQRGQAFNMTSIAGALPDYGAGGQGHRISGNTPPSASRNQLSQFASNSPYGSPYGSGHLQGGIDSVENQGSLGPQTQRAGMAQPSFSPFSQQMPQYYYPTSPFSPQGHAHFYPGQPYSPYDRRTSAGSLQSPPGSFVPQAQGNRTASGMPSFADVYGNGASMGSGEGIQRPASGGSAASVPRGPPRKPKQSGHALWVGNLPPGTTVLDLKDHFSRDATKDIESLFLISKSNCAFVNYRTETSCSAAMQRFHDSRFHGVRLVCRLRRTSTTTPAGAPSAPAAMTGASPITTGPPQKIPTTLPVADSLVGDAGLEAERQQMESGVSDGKVKEKYFVVKSLTLQDLELSVRNGIWATQSHNEQGLNKAFEAAENVYLIFSANKSGEYFGYARMTSPISEDSTQVFASVPRHEPTVEASDAPKVIPTEATEFAPKGHIIDDSARGTIFWEADHSDDEAEGKEEPLDVASPMEDATGQQAWGKPFKVEWLSTNRLPFYRTRGLRNPWNANREVKIARDGTELEPGVGNRLLQMFHRMGQPPPPANAMPMQMMNHMAMGGVPPMRPF